MRGRRGLAFAFFDYTVLLFVFFTENTISSFSVIKTKSEYIENMTK